MTLVVHLERVKLKGTEDGSGWDHVVSIRLLRKLHRFRKVISLTYVTDIY